MSYQSNYAGYVAITSVDCPTTTNPHGYAAILMAASVMEFPMSVLPVKFTGFAAKTFTDNTQLSWQNADDSQVDHYIIQKSETSTAFSNIATIVSNQSGSYSWNDTNTGIYPVTYYRIQAVSKDGSVVNTNILSVKTRSAREQLIISPNPATGHAFNININKLMPGTYNLSIINSVGKTIDSKRIHTGNETTLYQTIQLPGAVTPGLYFVHFSGAGISLQKPLLIK